MAPSGPSLPHIRPCFPCSDCLSAYISETTDTKKRKSSSEKTNQKGHGERKVCRVSQIGARACVRPWDGALTFHKAGPKHRSCWLGGWDGPWAPPCRASVVVRTQEVRGHSPTVCCLQRRLYAMKLDYQQIEWWEDERGKPDRWCLSCTGYNKKS